MQSSVKVLCEGGTAAPHEEIVVGHFRIIDGGWARVFNKGDRDPLLWGPDGEVSARHAMPCPRCTYDGYFKPETLYPLLDEARERGWMPAPDC
jgi:hypothetical protein